MKDIGMYVADSAIFDKIIRCEVCLHIKLEMTALCAFNKWDICIIGEGNIDYFKNGDDIEQHTTFLCGGVYYEYS